MNIISKKEAEKKGLIKFFTGKPCRKGHTSERYVNGGRCLSCTKEHEKNNYLKTRFYWNLYE